jgi:AbrB family looped-hinge helix DNA binding protein
MGLSATLSSKFQISVPKEVREKENWKSGQKFTFVPKDGGYLLVRVPEREELFGIAKGANPDGYRDRDDRY